MEALKQVVDPEFGLNIVDLGLIYNIEVKDGNVEVEMTMTSPACPMRDYIVKEVEKAIKTYVITATSVCVRLVWDPPWSSERISDDAKRQLGWE